MLSNGVTVYIIKKDDLKEDNTFHMQLCVDPGNKNEIAKEME